MKIRIKKLHPDAIVPDYQSVGAGCFDLHAVVNDGGGSVLNTKVLRTGLAFEIPENWVMLVFSRSGHGFKNDVRLANCVGVIDSDYRGEVMVKLTVDARIGTNSLFVKHGDRIAQAALFPVEHIDFEEVSELSETSRSEGGFGSTGS